MSPLSIAGDVLWILALSIMASATRTAWSRMSPDTLVPMNFKASGAPGLRLKRGPALLVLPGAAFVVGLLLVVMNRNAVVSPDQALILFGVRATAAALFALYHLRWLKAAMDALAAEGALKDL
jgi:hypothetical protein